MNFLFHPKRDDKIKNNLNASKIFCSQTAQYHTQTIVSSFNFNYLCKSFIFN